MRCSILIYELYDYVYFSEFFLITLFGYKFIRYGNRDMDIGLGQHIVFQRNALKITCFTPFITVLLPYHIVGWPFVV